MGFRKRLLGPRVIVKDEMQSPATSGPRDAPGEDHRPDPGE